MKSTSRKNSTAESWRLGGGRRWRQPGEMCKIMLLFLVAGSCMSNFWLGSELIHNDLHIGASTLLAMLPDNLEVLPSSTTTTTSRPTTFLLGIFMTSDEKSKMRRDVMRKTILRPNDPRVCPLYKYMEQVSTTTTDKIIVGLE
jgi:hypothetical protein